MGVICHAPFRRHADSYARTTRAEREYSDTIPDGCEQTPGECERQRALDTYGPAFNQALVSQPQFPAPDVCRPTTPADKALPRQSVERFAQPARPVRTAPHDLHEAARRGQLLEVKRFLRQTPVDGTDMFGYTPLGWAVLRDRPEVVAVLLKAGAKPYSDLGRGGLEAQPLWLGYRLGRRRAVQMMLAQVDEPQIYEMHDFLNAAVQGGDADLLRGLLEIAPKDQNLSGAFEEALKSGRTDLVEVLASTQRGATADAMLTAAARTGDLDTAKLAISNGADLHGQGSPLGQVILGLHEADEAILEAMLRAGADVNRIAVGNGMSGPPLRIAVKHAYRGDNLGGEDQATAQRQRRIIKRLVAAGAYDRTRYPEQPPLAFVAVLGWNANGRPVQGASTMPLPDDILQALVSAGMDMNEIYHGYSLLGWVGSADPASLLLGKLRALGATESAHP